VRIIPAMAIACAAIMMGGASVHAQEAAEAAQVLSGVSGQGRASRSLGSAITGSIRRSAVQVGATGGAQPRVRSHGAAVAMQVGALPRGGHDLDDTDATRYRSAGGATISVSGRFRPATGATTANISEAADDPTRK